MGNVHRQTRALRPQQDVDWPVMPTEVDVEGQAVRFSVVEPAGAGSTNQWFKVASDRTLPRGAIRALFDAAGLKLNRAMLVRWGPVALPRDLPRGRWRALEGAELDALYALAGRDRVEEREERKRRGPRPPPDRRKKKSAATTGRRTGRR